jgi:hypothetical protein
MTETRELEDARETNRRLNRRLGEIEGPWAARISEAQEATRYAQEAARKGQESASYWIGAWQSQNKRMDEERAFLMSTLRTGQGIAFWLLLLVMVETGVIAWLWH